MIIIGVAPFKHFIKRAHWITRLTVLITLLNSLLRLERKVKHSGRFVTALAFEVVKVKGYNCALSLKQYTLHVGCTVFELNQSLPINARIFILNRGMNRRNPTMFEKILPKQNTYWCSFVTQVCIKP